jgi:GDSL-like Lipase/Acylhydrolase family
VPERIGKRAVLRALVLLLCVVVAALAATELLLRVTEFGQPKVSDGTYGAYRFDAELGWLAPPNSTSVQPSSNRTVALQHNSLGIRERELSDIAPDRLLFLGDSFTWGYDAEADERFTNLLQQELPQYGIVNAGIAGYGTDQQFLLMERLWTKVNPKVVVVTFCVNNDRDDNSSNLRYRQYKPYFVRAPNDELQVHGYPLPLPGSESSERGGWLANLALVRFAVHSYATVRNRETIVPDPTERLFDMMQRTVEARGARLVVGLQRHQPRLEAHLRARGIPYTSFDGAPFYVEAGEHWTPEGNAQVARQYLALFKEIGMLQSLAPPSGAGAAPVRDGSKDDQALAQSMSVLSPSIWLAAARALPAELVGFGEWLKYWAIAVMDNRALPHVAVALLLVTVLACVLFVLWFWWRRRVSVADGSLDRLARARASFGVFLGLALAMPLSMIVLLQSSKTYMLEVSYGFVAGVIVAAFGRAVALGLFAPDAPQRRLIAVDDATARSLCAHLVWATRALGALIVLLAIHKGLAAPVVLRVATNMLFALVVGATLLHLLISHRQWTQKPTLHVRWLFALGWLLVGGIGIALIAGYPAVATSVAAALVSIVMVAGALYLVLALGRVLWAERLALDTPRGEAIAANFGVGLRWLGVAVVLTYGGMCLAVALAALVLYLGPW